MSELVWEYAIFRKAGTPKMSGEPNLNRIVNVPFHSLEEAEGAARRVPSLRGVPVIIARRKITAWEVIE